MPDGCQRVITFRGNSEIYLIGLIVPLSINESRARTKGKGKIEDRGIQFVAFGGDGGTYDIGLQSLSGALERGHNFLYVCYDNQAYMNTGIQRSSATPHGAATTTSPAGSVIPGKPQFNKEELQLAAFRGRVRALEGYV